MSAPEKKTKCDTAKRPGLTPRGARDTSKSKRRRIDMLDGLQQKLEKLEGCSALVSENDAVPPERGEASVKIVFSDGTELLAAYWRVIKNGRASISSFDHGQQYGLPAPIDAVEFLAKELQGQLVTDARHDEETGDLLFWFTNNVKWQIFNVTGYEIWEIGFPDGTGEYSNYAK
jgi:hypothetical protein